MPQEAYFLETTVLVPNGTGLQVLNAPEHLDGDRVEYDELLNELPLVAFLGGIGEASAMWHYTAEGKVAVVPLHTALSLVADPTARWSINIGALEAPGVSSFVVGAVTPIDETLMTSPLFATELSPISKRALGELVVLATQGGFVLIAGLPAIVLVGTGAGIVILRSLRAVSGAVWEGARPEVVEFGGDAASTLLNALRRRLGIERRGEVAAREPVAPG
jgi:hypothetical protein